MNTFVINDRRYTAKEFTFGTIRKFEGLGLSMADIQNKPMTLVAAYLSYCANISIEAADEEINEHILKDGSFEEILKIITEEMNNSRFFQHLNKKKETEDQETQEIEASVTE